MSSGMGGKPSEETQGGGVGDGQRRTGSGSGEREVYDLGKECELRIESSSPEAEAASLQVKLLDGSLEVFGTEIAKGQKVDVTGQNVALFTYHGAKVEVIGRAPAAGAKVNKSNAIVYETDETPMVQYANVHSVLQKARKEALREIQTGSKGRGSGPRCLIAGPTDVGKSTLTKILTNYAVREGNTPLLVDLDIGQGMLTVPGTIASVLVEDVANIETGSFSQENALTFFYGHASPSENIQHYKLVVERMAAVLESFLDSKTNPTAAASGVFVNTMGWIDGDGYDLLLHAIEKFSIDVVLVVGHDRLYSQLSTSCRNAPLAPAPGASASGGDYPQPIQVVKLPKSGGVVTRDSSYRKTSREKSIHAYFYGIKRELSPFSRSLQISQLQVYRVGGGFKAPLSALPIGSTKQEDTMKVTSISITRELTHSLLAVSHANDPSDLLHCNVAGFIHVTEVDLQKGILTYLSPSPGPLPSPILIAGTVKCFLK